MVYYWSGEMIATATVYMCISFMKERGDQRLSIGGCLEGSISQNRTGKKETDQQQSFE